MPTGAHAPQARETCSCATFPVPDLPSPPTLFKATPFYSTALITPPLLVDRCYHSSTYRPSISQNILVRSRTGALMMMNGLADGVGYQLLREIIGTR